MKKLFVFIIINLVCINTFCNCNVSEFVQVISLMGQRANVIKDVAAYKWYYAPDHKAVPYDAEQERKVLENATNVAKQIGINSTSLMVFAQIQMDVSKQIETYWINYWNDPNTPIQAKPTETSIKNLNKLRNKIANFDTTLYPTIEEDIPSIQQCTLNQMQPAFFNAFAKVFKVPGQPNFRVFVNMLIQSLKQVSYKR